MPRCLAALLGVLVLQGVGASAAEALRDWENPRLVGVNRRLPHATMIACPDAKTAAGIRWASSRSRRSNL